MLTAQQLIQHYGLQPHPEGGWYKETYRSSGYIPEHVLPAGFSGRRVYSTSIYFLLEQDAFSAFHRIRSDECWHFYAGGALYIYVIQLNGEMEVIKLGNEPGKGQLFQYTVPANCWFASRPATGTSFSFVGCTVSPGFDFADFELADAVELSALFPMHETIIKEMCR